MARFLNPIVGPIRAQQLARVPDLTKAPPEIERQVFEAFEWQIAYDEAGGRVELSANRVRSRR